MAAELDGCSQPNCEKPARLAVRTTRPSRDVMKTVIFYDDRSAPGIAERLCREHGIALVATLMDTLVDLDD